MSLFLSFLSFYFLCVSSLRRLMQTSEHAVLHWAHLVFPSQVLDPDKERYDFQIWWKLKSEVKGGNAISAQSLISLVSNSCNCKIELHWKIPVFVHPDLIESSCGKRLWNVICHSRPHIWKQNSKQPDKFFCLICHCIYKNLKSDQRSYKFIYKISCLSLAHLLLFPKQSHPVLSTNRT